MSDHCDRCGQPGLRYLTHICPPLELSELPSVVYQPARRGMSAETDKVRAAFAGLDGIDVEEALGALDKVEWEVSAARDEWRRGQMYEVIHGWLAENMPRALELCPYKVAAVLRPPTPEGGNDGG